LLEHDRDICIIIYIPPERERERDHFTSDTITQWAYPGWLMLQLSGLHGASVRQRVHYAVLGVVMISHRE